MKELFTVEDAQGETLDESGDGGFTVYRTQDEAYDALANYRDGTEGTTGLRLVRFVREER